MEKLEKICILPKENMHLERGKKKYEKGKGKGKISKKKESQKL